jgi:hypothetical protein
MTPWAVYLSVLVGVTHNNTVPRSLMLLCEDLSWLSKPQIIWLDKGNQRFTYLNGVASYFQIMQLLRSGS